MISNCGKDENNQYHGGKAGDQTGEEWKIRSWYNRPWNCILRYKGNEKVNQMIADFAIESAKNDKIGYDQWQRITFWNALKNSGYEPSKITSNVETDCSAGVLAIVKAVGYKLNIKALKDIDENGYTGNMRAMLKKAGFSCLTASKYLTSETYLERGDILLNDSHHTAIEVGDGKLLTSSTQSSTTTQPVSQSSGKLITKLQPAMSFSKSLAGKYKVTASSLNLRYGADSNKYGIICAMPNGETVTCYGYYTDNEGVKWLLVKYSIYTGFACSTYLKKK